MNPIGIFIGNRIGRNSGLGSSYWTQQTGARTFDQPMVVFTFDEVTESQYTAMFPLFVSKGIKGTIGVVGAAVGTAGCLTWDQLKEMKNAGMELSCHGYAFPHLDYTTKTEAQILADLDANTAAFIANGLTAPQHHAYPLGYYTTNIKGWIKDSNKRSTCRGITGYHPIFRDSDRMSLSSLTIDNIDEAGYGYGGTHGMDFVKKFIDYIIEENGALIFYCHTIANGGGVRVIDPDKLEEIIDYCQSNGVLIKTQGELARYLWEEPIITPDEFTLTARGDGTGVATLRLNFAEDTILRLTGNAKFYTDAAGTLNESQEVVYCVNDSARLGINYLLIYIRCASGASTLKIEANKLYEFQVYTAGVTAPQLTGDVSKFKFATSLNMTTSGATQGIQVDYPNVTNIKRLSELIISSGNKVLTSANVNQLLADFVLNKDYVKAITGTEARLITLNSTAGTGAPTGQGIIDKAALQAYKSPGDNAAYQLWTVNTRV